MYLYHVLAVLYVLYVFSLFIFDYFAMLEHYNCQLFVAPEVKVPKVEKHVV